MKRFLFAVLASVALGMGYTAPAFAVPDLLFTFDGSNGGPGTFGTVRLHQLAGGVEVTVTPSGGFVSSGDGEALLFNLTGHPNLTGDVSLTTAGFSLDPTLPPNLIHADGSGNWQYGIICDVPAGCGNGGSNPNPGPLVFDINLAGLSINDFIFTNTGGQGDKGSNGFYFASATTDGLAWTNTAGVPQGGDGSGDAAPEPGSLLLLAAGLMGLGGMRWKRGLSGLRKSA